jgi:hypothetical protein
LSKIFKYVILKPMKTSRILSFGLLLLTVFILTGCTLPFIGNKKSALQINASPQATIFLNDNNVGKTPYLDENLKPGEYTIKLVPESEGELLTWQGLVKLYPGIMTAVSRNLAASEEQTSGYTVTLEPIAEKDKARISIISTPDGVVVNLDGEPKGFTPISIDDIVEGEREIVISAPGFKE